MNRQICSRDRAAAISPAGYYVLTYRVHVREPGTSLPCVWKGDAYVENLGKRSTTCYVKKRILVGNCNDRPTDWSMHADLVDWLKNSFIGLIGISLLYILGRIGYFAAELRMAAWRRY